MRWRRVCFLPLVIAGSSHVERCLVIVARDQPELFERLASIYAHEGWIEVLLDRRHGPPRTGRGDRPDRRSPPSPATDLQHQGFIVIPRPEIVGASP